MPLHVAEAAGLIRAGIGGKRLLDHPFYRRWEAGTLARSELAAYAEQYRHIEAALPEVLSRVASSLVTSPPRTRTATRMPPGRGEMLAGRRRSEE